ncbi:MAG: hypothetical protein HN778_15830 [Prolixibacteraceae bacterium]|jgi:hypothetical protein|nr:hypothetical protein [Prolixibacteraceae bacterium]MBT6005950.1 hypothetical protein [Prolixibacteraceae bacterium]MBT6763876.1 hypothetical protein [Prolixibacteraceae bacterium]MBT6998253.1 hypothetical protein [Prolixibacteraceae bacterium]MBT7396299.1 hypothetical protein [Prolixibacteraceae bacterium]
MKKLLVLAFLVAIVSGTLTAGVAQGNKDIVGEWKFESPNAPYGYDKGSFIFSEKEGKLVGEIKFAEGYKMELKEVTFSDDELNCNLYVDYNLVKLKGKIEGKKLTGTADSPEGALPFTAEKVK